MNTLTNQKYRFATLKQLKAINKNSIRLGFNRNIEFNNYCSVLKDDCITSGKSLWRGLNTAIVLRPVMLHSHKAMLPCEPHVRAEIYDCARRILFIDIAIDDWEKLSEWDENSLVA